MRIVWSLPVPGEPPDSTRGDLVRARRLVAALRAAGHEVELVAASQASGTGAGVRLHRSLLKRLLPRRASLVLRDLARASLAKRQAARVAAAARRLDAQLLIETQVHGVDSGHRAARLTDLPLVLDDCSPPGEELALGSGLPRRIRESFARQLAAARLVVTITEQAREQLIAAGAEPGRVRIVPNGVELAEHEAARRGRAARRRELGLGDGELAAVFVGSFQPWHRAELLAEAVAGVADRRVRAVFVGDGPGRPAAVELAARHALGERCLFLGGRPAEEIAGLLAACDAGVLPDSNEHGHPMKLVDYAAARLALVAPDVAPVRALVRDGETGLLVPRADAQALAAALDRLAGDEGLRRRLGEAAHEALAAPADWSRRAAELLP